MRGLCQDFTVGNCEFEPLAKWVNAARFTVMKNPLQRTMKK